MSEEGREPLNVEVVVQEPKEGVERDGAHVHLFLMDESGVFREIEVETKRESVVALEETAASRAEYESELASPECLGAGSNLEEVHGELQ